MAAAKASGGGGSGGGTLWTVCFLHFLPLQKVFLSFGTFTIWSAPGGGRGFGSGRGCGGVEAEGGG